MVKKFIKIIVITEFFILLTYFFSPAIFANIEVAFLSSFFIIIGSSFAYNKMVQTKVDNKEYEEEKDLLDTIEDPHELYDNEPINEAPVEELNLKEIVKEERAKIKTFSWSSIKHGARGSVSLFRILPYIFLILGFIALKNNNILDIAIYLPSIFIGIVVGYLASKDLF